MSILIAIGIPLGILVYLLLMQWLEDLGSPKRRSTLRIPEDVRRRAEKMGVDEKDIDWYCGRKSP
jgi:hypothetical protein